LSNTMQRDEVVPWSIAATKGPVFAAFGMARGASAPSSKASLERFARKRAAFTTP
jgi:hypothetical protein